MDTMDGTTLPESLGIDAVIRGLGDDLIALREGRISNNDARARADVAKQIMAGFRLVLQGQKFIDSRLPPPGPAISPG